MRVHSVSLLFPIIFTVHVLILLFLVQFFTFREKVSIEFVRRLDLLCHDTFYIRVRIFPGARVKWGCAMRRADVVEQNSLVSGGVETTSRCGNPRMSRQTNHNIGGRGAAAFRASAWRHRVRLLSDVDASFRIVRKNPRLRSRGDSAGPPFFPSTIDVADGLELNI